MKQKRHLIITITLILLLTVLFAVQTRLGYGIAEAQTASQFNIDVFTNKGGIGANVNSSIFGPQEIVQMYANITYRNVGLVNQDVVFSVNNANGSLVAIRTARTNSTGIAAADFRMPLNSNTSMSFGTWSITAMGNITQSTVSDKTYFTFNYLNQINNQNLQVPSSVHRLENLTISVTISNLTNSTALSELDITLFDQAQVPIGSYTTRNMQNGTIQASILIPSWAFIGEASVYVCLLTADGTAIAPENAVTFQILPTEAVGSNMVFKTAFSLPEYVWAGPISLVVFFVAFATFSIAKRRHQVLQKFSN